MFPALRIAVAVASALLLLVGMFLVVGGGPPMVSGLWLLVVGGTGLIVTTLERTRYRSEAAELTGESPGPAGIDTGPPEPRFRPTEERFVDPTTRRRLRVWVDPSTGERRYRADDTPA